MELLSGIRKYKKSEENCVGGLRDNLEGESLDDFELEEFDLGQIR